MAGSAVAGDIYCNAARNVCSDVQTPGSQLVIVRGIQSSSSPASNPATPAASPSSPDNDSARRAAVQKDVATIRAEQCKKAQERYEQSINARRIYKEKKDGEREYLTDAEADAMRVQARADRDAACGPTATTAGP